MRVVSMALTLVTIFQTHVLTASLFTTSLNLLKSRGPAFNISISNSSTSDFKLAKSVFLVTLIYRPTAFTKSDFAVN